MADPKFPEGSIARVCRGPIEGHYIRVIPYARYLELAERVGSVPLPDGDGRVCWEAAPGVRQRRGFGAISTSNLERLHYSVSKVGTGPFSKRWYFATEAKGSEFIGTVIHNQDPNGVEEGEYFLDALVGDTEVVKL